MRRWWVLLVGTGLIGFALGCSKTMHCHQGVCDCYPPPVETLLEPYPPLAVHGSPVVGMPPHGPIAPVPHAVAMPPQMGMPAPIPAAPLMAPVPALREPPAATPAAAPAPQPMPPAR